MHELKLEARSTRKNGTPTPTTPNCFRPMSFTSTLTLASALLFIFNAASLQSYSGVGRRAIDVHIPTGRQLQQRQSKPTANEKNTFIDRWRSFSTVRRESPEEEGPREEQRQQRRPGQSIDRRHLPTSGDAAIHAHRRRRRLAETRTAVAGQIGEGRRGRRGHERRREMQQPSVLESRERERPHNSSVGPPVVETPPVDVGLPVDVGPPVGLGLPVETGDALEPANPSSVIEEYPGCIVENPEWIGDGACDEGVGDQYNTAECGWDGGDCLELNERLSELLELYPNCTTAANPSWLGDGFCDFEGYNVEECGWDGGDCCYQTCDGGEFGCYLAGGCRNPAYIYYDESSEDDRRRRREREILKLLFNVTNGDEWYHRGDWNNATIDHCYWLFYDAGAVTCNKLGYVEMIYFEGDNNLRGTLLTEIGELESLMGLVLMNSPGLAGTVPTQVGQLSNLSGLVLTNSPGLAGTVPTQLGQLSNLSLVYFFNTSLAGTIPAELGRLIQLEEVDFGYSNLTGTVPASFAEAAQLQTLGLRNTLISGPIHPKLVLPIFGPPAEYYSIQSNSELDSFGKLNPHDCIDVSRQWKDASGHTCDWYKEDVSRCDSGVAARGGASLSAREACCSCDAYGRHREERDALVTLYDRTGGNYWYDGTSWKDGSVIHCNWNGIDCNDDYRVTQLVLPSNGLSGDLPDSIGDLKGLERLDLSRNSLTNSIPSDLTDLVNLKVLDLSNNTLFGQIPSGIASMNKLRFFNLSRNELDGDIPLALTELRDVIEIRLASNNITGRIWPQFQRLSQLQLLDLQDNSLSGGVPSELGLLDRLMELRLSNNKGLSGRLFGELGELEMLRVLELSGCSFTDTIPREFGKLEKLEKLDLSTNLFSGKIPFELGYLSSLQHLDLKSNSGLAQPDGNVLAPLSICKEVKGFDLGKQEQWCPYERLLLKEFHDDTKGDKWSQNAKWTDQHVSHCDWHGVKCNDTGAVVELSLQSNSLSGTLPPVLFDLTSLQILRLNNNFLRGTLPSNFSKLSNLHTLYLAGNRLTGSVSGDFRNLTSLAHLRLEHNRFTGGLSNIKQRQQDGTTLAFIADCGSPYDYSNGPLTCDSCTMCCNSEGKCQEVPKHRIARRQTAELSEGEEWLTLWTIIVSAIFVAVLCVLLCCVAAFAYFGRKYLTALRRTVYQLCGEESVYMFLLTTSHTGWFISIGAVAVQFTIFVVYLRLADFYYDNTVFKYTQRCPPNGDSCHNEDERTILGWLVFGFLMGVKIAPDLINGFALTYMSGKRSSFKCLLAGAVLILISGLAVWTSTLYNYATATNDSDLIINAVVLVIVNEVDEMLFQMLKALFPTWIDDRVMEAEKYASCLAPWSGGSGSDGSNYRDIPTDGSPPQPETIGARGVSGEGDGILESEEDEEEEEVPDLSNSPSPNEEVGDASVQRTIEAQQREIERLQGMVQQLQEENVNKNKELETKFGNLERIISQLGQK